MQVNFLQVFERLLMAGGVLARFQLCHRTQPCMPMKKQAFWKEHRPDIEGPIATNTTLLVATGLR